KAGPSDKPNPPASSASVRPWGSSRSASGLPCVSATIRSRTRSSSGPVTTVASNSCASGSSSPATTSSGSPSKCRSALGSRTATTSPTDSATRRRATNASACAEAASSHCASSTMQTSGWSSAASDSRLSTAKPRRNRPGASPSRKPNPVASASRCGPGSCSMRSVNGAHSCCNPAYASSISDSTPTARAMAHPDACCTKYSNNALLPTPASPRTTSAPLRPARTLTTSSSSKAHSLRRPSSPPAETDIDIARPAYGRLTKMANLHAGPVIARTTPRGVDPGCYRARSGRHGCHPSRRRQQEDRLEISMTEVWATTRTELAHRSSGGVDVTLVWVRGGDRGRNEEVLVCVWDERDGTYFEIPSASNLALDTFYHPFAYRDFRTVEYRQRPLAA